MVHGVCVVELCIGDQVHMCMPNASYMNRFVMTGKMK